MEVLTNSVLIKQIREHIIEFLLINHPLDCPICDQGGECDLQDQTLIYGSDRGRFKEIKRSVFDKNFGPFIKTVMTRCIHCTKCVRFIEEYGDRATIGTLGRGGDTEIGIYSNAIIKTELSGNIIDLCPVGALTSKPYAFKARSWELVGTESLDIFDSCGSNILIQTRSNEIMRILPRRNDTINESWITDQIRFGYDTFKKQRLLVPYVKNNNTNKLMPISWKTGIQFFIYNFKKLSNTLNDFFLFSGELLDVESLFMVRQFVTQYNIKNVNSFSWINNNFRNSYIMNSRINAIEFNSLIFILGLDFKIELPILNLKFKKSTHTNALVKNTIYYIGTKINSNIDMKHLGFSNKIIFSIFYGKHTATYNAFFENRPALFSRVDNHTHNHWDNYFPSSYKKIINNVISLNSGSLNQLELNVQSSTKSLINDFKNYFPLFSYFVGFDKLPIWNISNHGSLRVFQGSNFSEHIIDYNLFLPSSNFTEGTIRLYLNCEGRYQRTYPAVTSPGFSIKDSNIVYALLFSLWENTSSDSNNINSLVYYKSLLLWVVPSFKKIGFPEHHLFFLDFAAKQFFWVKRINYIPTIKQFLGNNTYSKISTVLSRMNMYRSVDSNFFNL
jgi:NADH dehydrogenase (ubiquinone) Fe-S protein 1